MTDEEREALLRENERLRARVAELEASTSLASNKAFRAVFEGSLDALLLLDDEGAYVDANPRACALFGVERERIVGLRVGELTGAEEHTGALWSELRANGTLRGEFSIVRPDGQERTFEYLARVNIAPGLHLSALRDTTEQRRAEEALRLSEDMFAKAFRASPIPLGISTAAEGRFVDVNDAAAALAGRTREELVGRTSRELDFWGDPTHTERLFTEMNARGVARRFPTSVRRPTGELVEVLLSTEVLDVRGQRCVLGVLMDLSEQRRAEEALRETEEQLRQLQRLEAIGTLSAGVAHDFNNLLSVILSYTAIVLDSLPGESPLHEDLEQIRLAGERAADLTRRLLAFGRRQLLAPRVLDLDGVLRGVDQLLRRSLGDGVALETHTDPGLGPVLVDPVQLEQVLVNLAVNARDAMPERGGRVRIYASSATLAQDDPARAGMDLAPGDYVRLTVDDDGSGMDRRTRERIFDPFFTTKEKGRGTGLGLSTVFGIVKQSGGGISVESALGEGTRMHIYLPRAERPEERAAEEARALATLDGTETILLAEDEEPLRVLLASTLRGRGYTVLSGANGAEALRVANAHEGPIDLLVSDVTMPEMSGPALAAALLEARPATRVLFLSGYTDDAAVRLGVQNATVALLHKPVLAAVLLRKVREVLASG